MLSSITRTRSMLAVVIVALAGSAATAGARPPGLYVALGDSYTSAPLVPDNRGTPLGCLRSDHDYPSLVARALGVTGFRDVSCSSATTRDMTEPQSVTLGTNAPQLGALSADAELVTVGIGGNDAGLVGVAETCAQLGLTAPAGTACRDRYAPGGVDSVATRIAAAAPKVAGVLRAIHERAPHARVAIVGYPDVLPRDGSNCYPIVPLSSDDVRYIDALIVAINAMIAEQAAANDAEFVDTYADSIGHDVCTLPGRRWFEGLVPTAVAYPLHPNALGEQSMARSAIGVLSAPAPVAAPALSALRRAHRTIPAGRAIRLSYRLDRPAPVAVGVRRRGARGHYSRVLRTVRAAGAAGANRLTISGRAVRTPGLYRLTATPAGGAPASTHVRVSRAGFAKE